MATPTSGTRALALIAVFLLLSAGMRAAIAASEVVKESGEILGSATQPESSADQVGVSKALPELLRSFKAREQAIAQKEAELAAQSRALETHSQRLKEKLSELKQAQASLRESLSMAEASAEDDVSRLTSVYEAMKPKLAATMVEQMEPVFAAGLLARMRVDAAAAVFSNLTPETGYAISVVMAGRNIRSPVSERQ